MSDSSQMKQTKMALSISSQTFFLARTQIPHQGALATKWDGLIRLYQERVGLWRIHVHVCAIILNKDVYQTLLLTEFNERLHIENTTGSMIRCDFYTC